MQWFTKWLKWFVTFLQQIKSILHFENIPITYREDSIVFISNWSNTFIHEADPHCWNTGKKILSLKISNKIHEIFRITCSWNYSFSVDWNYSSFCGNLHLCEASNTVKNTSYICFKWVLLSSYFLLIKGEGKILPWILSKYWYSSNWREKRKCEPAAW